MREPVRRSEAHEVIRIRQAGADRGELGRRPFLHHVRVAWLALLLGVGFGLTLGVGMLGQPTLSLAKELHFVVRDVDGAQAVWFPREVLISRQQDLTEPLSFRLENPSPRTHVFEAPGLFESFEEGGIMSARPLRITTASEETLLVEVDRDRLADDVVGSQGDTMMYRFFCPLHRSDTDAGSRIKVIP